MYKFSKNTVAYLGGCIPFGFNECWYGRCDYCKNVNLVSQAPVRTNYSEEYLNIPPILCEECTIEYNEYWDDMWSNVPGYGGY